MSSTIDIISNDNLQKNENNFESKHLLKFPVLIFKCRVSRCAGYYFWNAYFLIFLITAAIFVIFAVKPTQTYYRLYSTAKLFLTSVIFKWSFSSRCLPTVNYLTSLDIYSIESIVLVFLCFVWHGFVTIFFNFFDYNTVFIIDKVVLGILFFVFILVNLTLLVWSIYTLKIRKFAKMNNQNQSKYGISLNQNNVYYF